MPGQVDRAKLESARAAAEHLFQLLKTGQDKSPLKGTFAIRALLSAVQGLRLQRSQY